MALAYTNAVRDARMGAISTQVGSSGLLRIYDGTRPATGAAITSQVLLAELTCAATFGTSSNGLLTVGSITQDSSANASGTATWFRVCTSGGTACIDGNVGTSGSDLNLNATNIVATGTVSVTSFTITEGNA